MFKCNIHILYWNADKYCHVISFILSQNNSVVLTHIQNVSINSEVFGNFNKKNITFLN
jgi:hypothetical protein